MRAPDDARADRLFEIALLGGREFVIEDDEIGAGGRGFCRESALCPALREWQLRRGPRLDEAAHDLGACASG